MADSVSSSHPVFGTPAAAEPAETAPRPPRRGRTYSARFAAAYCALALILGAVGVGTWYVVDHYSGTSGGSWSTWRPTADGINGAKEIAKQVGAEYRLPGGKQLVAVLATEPQVQQIPITAVAVRPADAQTESDISIYSAKNGIQYVLCGLGKSCAITDGKPSLERARLLRREAIELALYSFKYLGVDSVLAFLPPRAGKDPTFTLYFRKADLKQQLSLQLTETLGQRQRVIPEDVTQSEATALDRLAGPHLFEFKFQQGPDGNPILVLQPYAI